MRGQGGIEEERRRRNHGKGFRRGYQGGGTWKMLQEQGLDKRNQGGGIKEKIRNGDQGGGNREGIKKGVPK